MAWTAATEWEVRGSGNDLNGGAFDSSFGGIDYSQQDAAQVTLGDFATPGAGSTTLTSASSPFTAQMVGNSFHPQTGGNFVEDFYCITAFVGAGQVTLDRSPTPGGAGAAGNGTVGGGLATLDKIATHADYVAGNTIWIQGNVALLNNVTLTVAGTAANPIYIMGYNATRGDWPLLANRPTLSLGAFTINANANMRIIKNIIFVGSATSMLNVGMYATMENCKVQCTSAVADALGLIMGGYGKIIGCDLATTNGYALSATGGYVNAHGCYLHDSRYGANIAGYGTVSFSVFDTLNAPASAGKGLILGSYQMASINNTFYACDSGIYGSGAYAGIMIINNILSDCALYGINITSLRKDTYCDYNDFHNNGTDRNNILAGAHDLALDPQFTDAPNGDFSIGAKLKAAAYPGAFDGGLSTGYLDMGAIQRRGGSGGGWGFVY